MSTPKLPIAQTKKANCATLSEKAQKAFSDMVSATGDALIQIGKGIVSALMAPINTIIDIVKADAKLIENAWYDTLELPQIYGKALAEKTALVKRKWHELTTPADCTDTSNAMVQPVTPTTFTIITQPQTISSKTFEDALSNPSSNDAFLQSISPDYKMKKLLEDSKSKTIDDQKTVVNNVMNSLDSSSIPAMRQKVRLMYGKNPELDTIISAYEQGKPASEYIGSWLLGNSMDKSSLQLKNWGDGTPAATRINIKAKLPSDNKDEIQKLYDATNNRHYNNLPKEFRDEQASVGFGITHGFHITGDYYFYKNHIDTSTIVGQSLATGEMASIGKANKMVNYLTPVQESITVESTPVLVIEENYEVAIDNRKNIVRRPLTQNTELA